MKFDLALMRVSGQINNIHGTIYNENFDASNLQLDFNTVLTA